MLRKPSKLLDATCRRRSAGDTVEFILVGLCPQALGLIDGLEELASETLDTLRDLARGIYPPLLADRGLKAALDAQARRAPIPVEIYAEDLPRYSQEIESAAYFCCLEALQNAAKYAQASKVTVRLGEEDGTLVILVSDDGRGFDPATTAEGAGMQNMTDRLEALGGTLTITSSPGHGTTVTGRIPTHLPQQHTTADESRLRDNTPRGRPPGNAPIDAVAQSLQQDA